MQFLNPINMLPQTFQLQSIRLHDLWFFRRRLIFVRKFFLTLQQLVIHYQYLFQLLFQIRDPQEQWLFLDRVCRLFDVLIYVGKNALQGASAALLFFL